MILSWDPYLHYICKDPYSKQGHILRFRWTCFERTLLSSPQWVSLFWGNLEEDRGVGKGLHEDRTCSSRTLLRRHSIFAFSVSILINLLQLYSIAKYMTLWYAVHNLSTVTFMHIHFMLYYVSISTTLGHKIFLGHGIYYMVRGGCCVMGGSYILKVSLFLILLFPN